MDKLDEKIIELLTTDARMTYKQIAEQVKLTSPAVKTRITKLEEAGIIKGNFSFDHKIHPLYYNLNVTGTVYFTRTDSPYCFPGTHLGIVITTLNASSSNDGSTDFDTLAFGQRCKGKKKSRKIQIFP